MAFDAVKLQGLLTESSLASPSNSVDERSYPLDGDVGAERCARNESKQFATGELTAAEISGTHHPTILPSPSAAAARPSQRASPKPARGRLPAPTLCENGEHVGALSNPNGDRFREASPCDCRARPMTLTLGLLVVLVTTVGAVAQRMAGLGFALLVSPIMTLLLGGHAGVLLVNILGVISSVLILPRVWRRIDWSMFRWLAAFAIIGAGLGAVLAGELSPDVMGVAVGAIVLLALVLSMLLTSERFSTEPRSPRAVAGFISGLTNALAGVGGPAVSAYAVLTRWPQTSFAATLQPYFAVTGLASAFAKLALDPSGFPETMWWFWLIVLAAIIIGIFIGERLLRLVTPNQVRRVVIALACAGAIATLVRGLVGLLT